VCRCVTRCVKVAECVCIQRERERARTCERDMGEKARTYEKKRARARECDVPMTSSSCEMLTSFRMRCLHIWLEAALPLALRCVDVFSVVVDVPCVTRRIRSLRGVHRVHS